MSALFKGGGVCHDDMRGAGVSSMMIPAIILFLKVFFFKIKVINLEQIMMNVFEDAPF